MRYPHFGEVSTLTLPVVDGYCDSAFKQVAETFTNNFVDHSELGASLCITVDGSVVVDLWGGHTDVNKTHEWHPNQLVNAFSVGKGITAILAARCVTLGILEYSTSVSDIWPEFASHGKDVLTVRDLLGHRSGLPSFHEPQPANIIFNWHQITKALANEKPWWTPGMEHGYHVNTFGFLIGEILRRVSHQTVGTLLQAELSAPLDAEVFIGLPQQLHSRVAQLQWSPNRITTTQETEPSTNQLMQMNAYTNPADLSGAGIVNTPQWRSAEMPSTNTHASARGVCRMYTPLAIGDSSLVSHEVLTQACTEVSNGTDRILERTTRFGHGFQLPIPERGFGPHEEAFGHYGAGGSLGYADPTARIGFGYIMNQMGNGWQNSRNRALLNSLYQCL